MKEEKSIDQEDISGRLTRQYLLALTAIAVFALMAQALVQHMLNTSVSDARIVNLLGRQRMFSQRICKDILILHQGDSISDLAYYQHELDSISKLWRDIHEGFKKKTVEDHGQVYRVNMSDSLRAHLFKVDTSFYSLYNSVQKFMHLFRKEDARQSAKSNMYPILREVLVYERVFVRLQDQLVYRYDLESKRRLEKLKYSEFTLLALTILVLIMEGLFIYRPAVLYIRKIFDALINSRKEAYDSNESLRKAEQELISAEKEKYLIQYNQHKIRSSSIIEGQEDERKRIAQELHDGLGQLLTTLKLKLERVHDKSLTEEKEMAAYLEAKKLLSDTIAEVRNISFNLMPSVLEDFGISSALKLLSEQVAKNTGLDVSFKTNTWRGRYDRNIEVGLYRITQEAINNAIKHSKAEKIAIVLEKKAAQLILRITDYGVGFSMRSGMLEAGNGIYNMQERAELMGGEFKVISKPGKGTRIYVNLPLT
ncbi:MAG: sensor histidine kinase [Cytophagaceae bacterium]|jgi:signal transduction histidine kinase|nr:sensor histidine kinase [Cytophagaceae bacterium]